MNRVVALALGGLLALLSATAAADLTALERHLIQELNLLRGAPPAYGRQLAKRRTAYRGTMYRDSQGRRIRTAEGVAALDEAVAALQRQPRLNPVTRSAALGDANVEWVRHQGDTNTTGHGDTAARLARCGVATFAENLSYGPDTGRELIFDLLIDDGVADRGHRASLLMPHWRYAGAHCGPHPRYGVLCALVLSDTPGRCPPPSETPP